MLCTPCQSQAVSVKMSAWSFIYDSVWKNIQNDFKLWTSILQKMIDTGEQHCLFKSDLLSALALSSAPIKQHFFWMSAKIY